MKEAVMSIFTKWNYAKTARILFFVAALFSAVAAVAFFLRSSDLQFSVRLVMSALFLVNGLILLGFAWALGQKPSRFAGLASIFVFLSTVAFIFDDLGLVDLIALFYYLAMFAVTLKLFFLSRRSQP
jgi:uncharacterized membrane protein YhaH (DUF805 family)